MIELNNEACNKIIKYFNVLKNFSAIDSTVEINLRQLALGVYEGCINTWANALVETLFTYNLEFISDECVEDVECVRDVIKRHNESISKYYYENFLKTYGYDECEDESVLNSDEYKENYKEYYLGIGIREVRLYSPLIKGDKGIYNKFLNHIPALVESCLQLYGNILFGIKSEFNKQLDKNIIIMYVMYDHGAFISDYCNLEYVLDDFELLLKELVKDLN